MKDKLIIKTYLEDISHQLKTPLTVINISLDNLIDNPNMDEKNRNEFKIVFATGFFMYWLLLMIYRPEWYGVVPYKIMNL